MPLSLPIPENVSRITSTLEKANFKAFLVGGCVRDLILNRTPKDWDITTDARPEEIVGLFPKTVYENTFGTVTVIDEEAVDNSLRNIEVTPFRLEGNYSDKRHPDKVTFSTTLEDDLKRRDFTINALAYSPTTGELTDLYGGVGDLKERIIRTVGEPRDRFQEDPLRILRAIRFSTQLGFTINVETEKALSDQADLLSHISAERIRDELIKIVLSTEPMAGIALCYKAKLLKYIIPELEEGIGMEQNGDHIYSVWDHSLRALQHAADKDWPLDIRLAALFHDIGKPRTRRWSEENKDWTFYGHDVVGARIADKRLQALKFPNQIREKVTKLVRNHMFFSDTDKVTLSAVRRIIVNVGRENIWDLIKVRACDRIGMGRPKENPYRLRKYEVMIEEALRQPTSVGMLKIDGKRVMEVTRETPGPKIGHILHALLAEVLEKPELNNPEYLEEQAGKLAKLEEKELLARGETGREKKEETEQEELRKLRRKHSV